MVVGKEYKKILNKKDPLDQLILEFGRSGTLDIGVVEVGAEPVGYSEKAYSKKSLSPKGKHSS